MKYFPVAPGLDLAETPVELRMREGGPFNVSGGVRQGYFWPLSSEFVSVLAGLLGFRWPSNLTAPELVPPEGKTPIVDLPLDLSLLREEVEDRGLELPDEVLLSLRAALESGKHVILTGPPGTGKTTLAEAVATAAIRAGTISGFTLTTATSDWTTFETIGGLRPADGNKLEFHSGQFLEAIQSSRWLIVDELNRSNFDRAFGQLFTVLSGQSVVLPYVDPGTGSPIRVSTSDSSIDDSRDFFTIRVPDNWRIIATMNVFDKSLLFEMSFALMRRFAFIEVPAPEEGVYWQLISQELGDSDVGPVFEPLLALNRVKPLGPATFIDMARFARRRIELSPEVSDSEMIFSLFYAFLLPQYEGADEREARLVSTELSKHLDPMLRMRLNATLRDVLGVEIKPPGVSEDEELPTEGLN